MPRGQAHGGTGVRHAPAVDKPRRGNNCSERRWPKATTGPACALSCEAVPQGCRRPTFFATRIVPTAMVIFGLKFKSFVLDRFRGHHLNEAFARAIERHRDEEPPRLNFSVPLDRLTDSGHCETLVEDLRREGPGGWETLKATATAWRKIPSSTGIYMFVWYPAFAIDIATSSLTPQSFPWILYVGKAGDGTNKSTLRSRYKGEYAKLVGANPDHLWQKEPTQTRDQRLRRYLNLVPLQYWYCTIDNHDVIESLEKRLFALFSPPLNALGSPRLRAAGKPKPAF